MGVSMEEAVCIVLALSKVFLFFFFKKASPLSEGFHGTDRPNSNSPLGVGVCRAPNPFCLFQCLLYFSELHDFKVLVSKYYCEAKRRQELTFHGPCCS